MSTDKPLVLVVDDQPKNLQLVAAVLKGEYKLVIADSGEKAIKAAKANRPNLILMDVMMPEMSGFEAAAILKADPAMADIPIIFLTAKNDTKDVVQGFEAGGVDYVLKPFVRQELLQRISTHVKLDIQRRMIADKNEQLDYLNNEKTKLLSVLSHDLRNMIGGNMGLLQIMESDFDLITQEELREFIGMISTSTTQTYNLMEDLLAWLKSQSKDVRMVLQPMMVFPIVKGVCDLFTNPAKQKSLTLSVDCPHDISFVADKNMIETILRNLINNAIKFSNAGGHIHVSVVYENDNVRFSVKDEGIGMSKDKLERLWVTAFESEPGTAGERGSGVGVNLCRTYVLSHQGSIWAESEVGKGSVFIFTIPRSLSV